jgi:hypothetical protein
MLCIALCTNVDSGSHDSCCQSDYTGTPQRLHVGQLHSPCRPAYMSASLSRGTMFMLCSSWNSSLQA